jgi:hypothetical protein
MSDNIYLALAKIVGEIEQEQEGDHDSGEILNDLISQLKSLCTVEKPQEGQSPADEQVETEQDIAFIWGLMPPWVKNTPEGLDPTMYGTLSAEGDRGVAKRLEMVFKRMRETARKLKEINN